MKKPKHIGIRFVLSWIISVLFILAGLGSLTSSVLGGLFILLGAAIILPPFGQSIEKKYNYHLSGWLKFALFIILVIIGISLTSTSDSVDSEQTGELESVDAPKEPEKEMAFEMTTAQLFSEFSKLSDLQIEEKIKELKGKRIKTSIYVSKIDKASLSSQYVAMEMYDYPYNLMPYVKAFFPKEEKEELLKANIGDTLVFSGEFVTYNKGSLTDGYIEFTMSEVLEIKSGSVTNSAPTGKISGTAKINECTKLCAGEEYDTPVYRDAWYDTCSQLYYYGGEEAIDKQIADCK